MERFFFYFLFFLVFLNSCSETEIERNQLCRINLQTPLAGLDPAFARDQNMYWLNLQLFNGLVRLSPDLVPEPCLAHTWQILDSGKTYRFFLRPFVRFQEHPIFQGKKRFVQASDFVYSFTRILNPQTASPGQWIFRDIVQGVRDYQEGKVKYIDGFKALNDSVLEIKLTRPFPPFLSLLTMPYASVVPPEIVEYEGKNFRFKPIGTGPYQLFHWTEGQQLILHKHKNHFEADSYFIDYLEFRFISSQLSAFAELVKGNIDFISGIDPMFKSEVMDENQQILPKYQDKLEIQTAPLLNTEYLAFRMDSAGIWQNIWIRKALAASIDKEALVKYLLHGLGTPANGGFSPIGIPGFNHKTQTQGYSLDSAQKYLALAGYPEGKHLPIIHITATPNYQKIMLFIQKSWQDIGIQTQIDILEGPVIREMVAKGRLGCWRASWVADYPDMENYLALLYSKNFSPQGPNTTHYANADFDAYYQLSSTLTSDSSRWNVYNQMEEKIRKDLPLIPLYYDQSLRMYRKGWKNLQPNAMNLLILKGVRPS